MPQEMRAKRDAGPQHAAPVILPACRWGRQEGADVFPAFSVGGCKKACAGQASSIEFCSQDILVEYTLALSRAAGCLEAIPHVPPGALENFQEHAHSCLLIHTLTTINF